MKRFLSLTQSQHMPDLAPLQGYS